MGLPTNDKGKNKTNNTNNNTKAGSKFIPKPSTKGAGGMKPKKTGGTRGS